MNMLLKIPFQKWDGNSLIPLFSLFGSFGINVLLDIFHILTANAVTKGRHAFRYKNAFFDDILDHSDYFRFRISQIRDGSSAS